MSYDDGKKEDYRLVSIFNQYGIKGTFHINSGLTDDTRRIKPEEFKTLYRGHEVSCHSFTHPTLARCTMEQVIHQILEDRSALEKIMGYPVRGLSYPNGSYNQAIKEVLPRLGIRYARVTEDTNSFAMPKDFLEWKATCYYNHNLLELGQQFIDLHKTQYLYMMYVWGHSYEFTDKNNWNLIEEFSNLVGHREDIWYAANIEIVDYMDVCDRLQFASDLSFVYNPSVQSAWLHVSGQIIEVAGGTQVNLASFS